MPKIFTSEKQKIGEVGENVAVKFLMKHSFSILDRNYTKKWGELDIIAEKNDKIYFIEVKSVTREILNGSRPSMNTIRHDSRGLYEKQDQYRPEENMHPWKIKRISRTIQTYLLSKKIPDEKEWQVDLLVVFLDIKNKKARIKVISDIVL
jgi:putative endonuclease